MEIIAYIWLSFLLGTGLLFIIEMAVITKLSDTNRFKIWWRNNIVGNAPKDIDI